MKIILYDSTYKTFLGVAWKFSASKLYRWWGSSIGVKSWDDLIKKLQIRFNKTQKKFTHIQIWGHGSPGFPSINKKGLSEQNLKDLNQLVVPTSIIWFRSCAVFFGIEGYTFIKQITKILNCTIAGHTHNIGWPWHSGLYTVHVNKSLPLSANKPNLINPLVSNKNEPRTIWVGQMTIPKGW